MLVWEQWETEVCNYASSYITNGGIHAVHLILTAYISNSSYSVCYGHWE